MIDYRGFRILAVFHYSNGRSDFEYYPIGNPEKTSICQGTIEDVKKEIDALE